MSITLAQARSVKAEVAATFKTIGKVVGVGITQIGDDFAVKVNLSEAPAADREVPKRVDGVPIQVEVVGALKKRER